MAILYRAYDADRRAVVHEQAAPEGSEPVLLAALVAGVPEVNARGNRLFGELFVQAYGPHALAAYVSKASPTPEQVFGVSEEDTAQMHRFLLKFAEHGRA
jgi:hypothetical protein